jgi:hypothetical protein
LLQQIDFELVHKQKSDKCLAAIVVVVAAAADRCLSRILLFLCNNSILITENYILLIYTIACPAIKFAIKLSRNVKNRLPEIFSLEKIFARKRDKCLFMVLTKAAKGIKWREWFC